MNDLTPDQLDRLESALASFDRVDGVAKARLLTALTADVPPRCRSPWKSRFEAMRGRGIRLATAATLVVAAVVTWQMSQSKSLFARTTRAMVRAGGYRCDLVEVRPAAGGKQEARVVGHLYWSSGGADRLDSVEGGKVRSTEIHRPGETGLSLQPETKQYRIEPRIVSREFSFGLFARLSEYRGGAGPPRATGEILGKKVEEYVVPWSRVIGDDSHGDAQMLMWLDPATSLPVRVDLVGFAPRKDVEIIRLEDFRWGEQDGSLFDTAVPAGYAKIPTLDVKADQIGEYVVYGLATFAKYNKGKYPAVKYVYGDEQGEALRKLMGMGPAAQGWVRPSKDLKWANLKDEEFAYGTSGLSWINLLQRENPDCVYRGKSVGGGDVDKVLLRWKLDDGQYRVIFGDLTAETVSAGRLKELESR